MANKVLDLLLRLTVQGGADADKLRASVEALKSATAGFRGRSLDDILNGTKAKEDIDLVVQKSKQLFDLIANRGKTPIDFNLGRIEQQLDLVVTKGRALIDLFARAGPTKVDFNLNQVGREMDLVTQKGRQLFDLVAARGRQKIDFDLGKIEAEAQRAALALRSANAAAGSGGPAFRKLAQDVDTTTASVSSAARQLLFFRRIFLAAVATSGIHQLLDLVKAFDQVRQAIATVFGESRAAEEFAFIKEQADRLGVSITGLGTEYAKFSIASRSLGLTEKEIRDVFLATAEAGAKLALSSEQVSGALTALQQIASKGRLSMEELRQQLGDRLPGAISIAAKALGVTEARLFELVSTGQVASDVFLRQFPAALRASFGTDATTRIETTAASIQRFKNALSETLDAAVRAGALEAFTTILSDLAKILRDPKVIDGLKSFSKGILDITTFARENINVIGTLIGAYAGFKLFGILATTLTGIAGAFSRISAVASPAAGGLAAAAVGAKDLATGASDAAPKVTGLAGAIASLALATKNPLVLVIAGLAAVDLALFEMYINKLDKAREKSLELKDAQNDIGLQGRLVKLFNDQAAALQEFSTTVALTLKELDSLSFENLNFYKKSVEGAKQLADVEAASFKARIAQMQAMLEAQRLSNDNSDEAVARARVLEAAITTLQLEQGKAVDTSNKWAAVLKDVATTFGLTAAEINKVKFNNLSKDAQLVVTAFGDVSAKSKDVAAALAKAIPDNFADGAVKGIDSTIRGLRHLIDVGKLTEIQVRDGIAKELDKLNGDQLAKFQVNALNAFGTSAKNAEFLATTLRGVLTAELKNMGLEAETAGSKVSKTFNELLKNLSAVAKNSLVTGDQLRGALDVAIKTAKTTEELVALRDTVKQLGLNAAQAVIEFERLRDSGTASARQLEEAFKKVVLSQALTDSLLRLDDAIRISAGKIDSALGDSFRRLGVTARQELKAMADQAVVDFNRIKDSGQATALELESAWRKMADEVTKLNNGIPPINILINAVNFNAFDLIVKAAEDASARTRKAIENAIPLVETVKQARALGDAIKEAFDKGKISADEFGKLITQVGFQMRELAAKPVGELAASAELLGVKTKDQLKAVADNAKEAFSNILASGQFTDAELAKGAQQFLDAYTAANNGVVDSFDPVVQAAQQVIDKINETTNSLDKLQQKAKNFTVDIGNLNDMSVTQLQELLSSTIKAYQQLGITNIENLQIYKEITKELMERGKESAAQAAAASKSAADARQAALDANKTNTPPPGGGGGASAGAGGGVAKGGTAGGPAVTNNFNFNGQSLTPDVVKREVMPIINDVQRRRL